MKHCCRILLVEDDDALRVCLDEFLAARGHRVHATGTGQEAVQWARQTPFDFSILDFHLPGMTGLDVLKAIRENHPIPSILMSGQASAADTADAERTGVFRFLRKPLDLAEFRTSVDSLILHHFGPVSD